MTSTVAAPGTTRRFLAGVGRPGLLWNAVRQNRRTLIAVGILYLACAAWVLANGILIHMADAGRLAEECRHGLPVCGRLLRLHNPDWALGVLPWLLGVFVGAPFVTREFETGSFRFSSVQGISLRRQTAANLAVFAALVVVASSLLGWLGTWAVGPLPAGVVNIWEPEYFSVTALTLPAFALVDLCLGVAVGALVRRTVPAMAVTTVGVLVFAALTTGWSVAAHGRIKFGPAIGTLLRSAPVAKPGGTPFLMFYVARRPTIAALHEGGWLPVVPARHGKFIEVLQPPSETPGLARSLAVTSWFTGPDGRLSRYATQVMLDRIPPHVANHAAELRVWMAARGIRYWVGVQPASRYWFIQAIVAALLLALAMLLASVAVWASRPERDHLRFRGRRLAAWP